MRLIAVKFGLRAELARVIILVTLLLIGKYNAPTLTAILVFHRFCRGTWGRACISAALYAMLSQHLRVPVHAPAPHQQRRAVRSRAVGQRASLWRPAG